MAPWWKELKEADCQGDFQNLKGKILKKKTAASCSWTWHCCCAHWWFCGISDEGKLDQQIAVITQVCREEVYKPLNGMAQQERRETWDGFITSTTICRKSGMKPRLREASELNGTMCVHAIKQFAHSVLTGSTPLTMNEGHISAHGLPGCGINIEAALTQQGVRVGWDKHFLLYYCMILQPFDFDFFEVLNAWFLCPLISWHWDHFGASEGIYGLPTGGVNTILVSVHMTFPIMCADTSWHST